MRAWRIGVLALCLVAVAPACKVLERVKGEAGDAGVAAADSKTGGPSTGAKPTPSAAGASTGSSGGAAGGVKDVVEIVGRGERAWGVAVDGESLYWTSNTDATKGIRKGTRAGASPVTLCKIADMLQAPEQLFVDDTHVYVLAPALGPSAVYRAAKSGATDKPCEKVADGIGLLRRGITKVGDTVYVAGTKKTGGVVLAIDKAGKSKPVLEWAKPIDGLATDGVSLFFTSADSLIDQRLMKVAPTGGTPTEMGKSGIHLTYASGRLVFVGGGLQSVPAAGGTATKHGAGGSFGNFAITGDTIYLGGRSGGPLGNTGALWRSTISGAEVVQIANVPKAVVDVAADAKDVYATGDGAIYRLAL